MAKTLGDCLLEGGVEGVVFIEKSSGKTYKVRGLSKSTKEREFILNCEFGDNTTNRSYLWNHYDDESAQSQPK